MVVMVLIVRFHDKNGGSEKIVLGCW